MALDYVTKQYGKASDKDKLNMILNIIMQNCMSELPVNICSNILIIINSIQRFQLLNEDNCLVVDHSLKSLQQWKWSWNEKRLKKDGFDSKGFLEMPEIACLLIVGA